MKSIIAEPLNPISFSQYGIVIEKRGAQKFPINNGKCIRHNAISTVDVRGEGASVIINIFSGEPYALPLNVTMVERHPLGSQAFYPLGSLPWLVIVCADDDGKPVNPQAFLASSNQGISFDPNTWHGVLTPLREPSDFLVVDRGGPGNNLEEYHFPEGEGFQVSLPQA